MSIVDWQLVASDLERQRDEYRNTVEQQSELLAAHKSEMQDWQRELLAAQQQVAALKKERDEREGLVCDQCIDGSGWCENAVEGRYPCTCMTEAEPYQLLQNQLAASQAREQKLRDAIDKEVPFVRTSDMPLIDAALALPTYDTALQERLKEERERCAVKCEQHGQTLGSILAAEIRRMT